MAIFNSYVKLPEGIPVIHNSSIIVGDWSIINYD